MVTFSAVSDKFVFNNMGNYESDELSNMGEYYGPIQIYPVEGLPAGTHIATVTVQGEGVDTIEAEVRFVVNGFIDVQQIVADVPSEMTAGQTITLSGSVRPSDATRREISWSVAEDGGTGALISGGNQLSAQRPGVVIVRARIPAGTKTGPFVKDFDITVNQAEEAEVCSKGVRAKGIADYKAAVSSEVPTHKEIVRLIGPGFKHIGSYKITGRITGTVATLSFPVQGASDDMTPHVLKKGNDGWELLPARYVAPNRITCSVTELSTFAVFADSGKLPTSGNSSSTVGSSGGGGGSQYTGAKAVSVIGMSGIIPSSEGRGVWEKSGETGWKFKKEEDGYAKSEWLRVNGIWYCFGADSMMLTGWQYINNIWYYFMQDGSMVNGWFLDPQNQKYFYFAEGAMVTGWRQIDGKYYYFNSSADGIEGAMAKDTQVPGGYYVGPDGVRVTE